MIYHKSRVPADVGDWPLPAVTPLSEAEKKWIRANWALLFPDGGPEDEEEAAAVLRARWQAHLQLAQPSDAIWRCSFLTRSFGLVVTRSSDRDLLHGDRVLHDGRDDGDVQTRRNELGPR